MSRASKWTCIVILLFTAGLFPAEAASPELAGNGAAVSTRIICGGIRTQSRQGSCDAGGSCCFGVPEAQCGQPIY